jgi:hypothetical protein
LQDDASPRPASLGPASPELLLELPELEPLDDPELAPLELLERPLELPELEPPEDPELVPLELEPLEELEVVPLELLERPLELPELEPPEEPELVPLELLELEPLVEPELAPLELPELEPLEEPELVPLELLDAPASFVEPGAPPLLSSPHPNAPTNVNIKAALETTLRRMRMSSGYGPREGHGSVKRSMCHGSSPRSTRIDTGEAAPSGSVSPT